MTHLERMMVEEAQIDNDYYGTGDDPTAVATPAVKVEEPVKEEEAIAPETTPTDVTVIDDQPAVEEEANKQSWKKRFTQYKASTDNTIATLRRENADALEKLSGAMTHIDGLIAKLETSQTMTSTDIFDGALTQEDSDIIGEEAVDIMKRATRRATENATAPLQAELKRLKDAEAKSIKLRAEAQRQTLYENSFLKPLEALVPDYATIDSDPAFLDFLKGYDVRTGMVRQDLLGHAESSHDAGRVADFFIEFKKSRSDKESILSKKVTPVSTGNGTTNRSMSTSNTAQTFSESDIEKNYRDFQKGRYRGREKDWKILEAKMDKAYIEGNIY